MGLMHKIKHDVIYTEFTGGGTSWTSDN